MRLSSNTTDSVGAVRDGYDYSLQVWVRGGIVQLCGHPATMRQTGRCCNAARYSGQLVREIPGHDVREG